MAHVGYTKGYTYYKGLQTGIQGKHPMSATTPGRPGDASNTIRGIRNQIEVWAAQSVFEDHSGKDVDRVLEAIDWDQEIDSTLSASRNWDELKERYNLKTRSEHQNDQRKKAEKSGEYHARRALDKHAEAVVNGEKPQLIADLRDEFGDEWVNEELTTLRAQFESDDDMAPVPAESPIEPTSVDFVDEPEPEPANNPIPELRDYSGVVGFGRLVVDSIKIPLMAGYYHTISEEKHQ